MHAIMSRAFFLIPGARLPARLAADLLAHASHEEAAALRLLGSGREAPETQCLTGKVGRLAPHYAWCWKVFARRPGEPQTAPALWRLADGPHFDAPLMRLIPLARQAAGFVEATLAERNILPLLCALSEPASRFGLRLQVSGTELFLSSATERDFAAAPVAAPAALMPLANTADFDALFSAGMEGPDTSWAHDVLAAFGEKLASDTSLQQLNELRAVSGLPRIEGFWLSTPGRVEGYHPPSLFRAVLADDGVLRGWALAAGIPAAFVRPLTPRKTDESLPAWPKDVPPGDVVAVVDDLYAPWLAGDLAAWRHALPAVVQKLEALRAGLSALKVDEDALVLFGTAGAATLMPQARSFFDRLRRTKNAIAPETWLADPYEEAFR